MNPEGKVDRTKVGTGTAWEERVGYSRAVRVGPFVLVSGTTATGADGTIVGIGDPYAQAIQALQNVKAALRASGADLADVVRTRMYGPNIDDWEPVGRAHAEAFREVRPATTMVEVRRLIAPEVLVEIEAEAVIAEPRGWRGRARSRSRPRRDDARDADRLNRRRAMRSAGNGSPSRRLR